MEISIKTVNGKCIKLEVDDSSDTIDLKIYGPTRQLVLRLGPESDPNLDPKASMQIFVSKGIETFNFMVEGIETVGNVLETMYRKGGHSVDKHMLIFQGEELENIRTLADYKIKNDSTLVLMPRY